MASNTAVSRPNEDDSERGAPRGHSEPAPHHHVNYLLIFAFLIVLTVATVAVAFKRFDQHWINLGIALAVASLKALLVARYFMHLKFEGKLIKLTLIFPILLCIIMIAALIPDLVIEKTGKEAMADYDQPATAPAGKK